MNIFNSITYEESLAVMVPAYLRKGKALAEAIKTADSVNSVADILKNVYGCDTLRHCATLLGVDVTAINHNMANLNDYKAPILAKAQEIITARKTTSAPEYHDCPDESFSDATGDNSAPTQDIPPDHVPDAAPAHENHVVITPEIIMPDEILLPRNLRKSDRPRSLR